MDAFEIRPATAARFEDVVTILGPKRAGAQGCWCLSVRLGHEQEAQLRGAQRSAYMQRLCRRQAHAPGVLAYEGSQVLGWAGASPLTEIHEFTHGRRYPSLEQPDELWVVWCLRVRGGHGRRGVATQLVGGAASYAEAKGAAGIVGFPVDNGGATVDRTLASVGTRTMFERNGFQLVGQVDGMRAGFSQVAMRRDFIRCR